MITESRMETYCWICREQTMHTGIVDTPQKLNKDAAFFWVERIAMFFVSFGISEIFLEPVFRCDKCGYRERFDGTIPSTYTQVKK
jgi:hypothetical protein